MVLQIILLILLIINVSQPLVFHGSSTVLSTSKSTNILTMTMDTDLNSIMLILQGTSGSHWIGFGFNSVQMLNAYSIIMDYDRDNNFEPFIYETTLGIDSIGSPYTSPDINIISDIIQVNTRIVRVQRSINATFAFPIPNTNIFVLNIMSAVGQREGSISCIGNTNPCRHTAQERTIGSIVLTAQLTNDPTINPTSIPTHAPTNIPTYTPTYVPSENPTTGNPTNIPTNTPSVIPSGIPTALPTGEPSNIPTISPSDVPSKIPLEITKIPTIHRLTASSSTNIMSSVNPTESSIDIEQTSNAFADLSLFTDLAIFSSTLYNITVDQDHEIDNDGSSLTKGSVVLIILAEVLFVVLLLTFYCLVLKRKQKRRNSYQYVSSVRPHKSESVVDTDEGNV